MSITDSFPRTFHRLSADRSRTPLFRIVVITLILAAWSIWLVAADVGVYIRSEEAGAVVDTFVIDLQSPVTDRVVAVRIGLGDQVRKGDTLVELDVAARRREYREEQTRLQHLSERIAATDRRIAALNRTEEEQRKENRLSVEEAGEHVAEAEASTRFAESKAKRLEASGKEGSVSMEEQERGQTEATVQQRRTEGLRKNLARLEQESRTGLSRLQAEIEGLRSERAELEGEMAEIRGRLLLLEEEINRRILCAPASGRIAEIYNVAPGSILSEGKSFGAIVPEGNVKVQAFFNPDSAPGRIRIGQEARIRFSGFPWIEYGTVPARIIAVAQEPHENRWRAELTLLPDSASRIPIRHGLRGSVEVQVERVSPATLLLRLIGAAAG